MSFKEFVCSEAFMPMCFCGSYRAIALCERRNYSKRWNHTRHVMIYTCAKICYQIYVKLQYANYKHQIHRLA